MTSLSTDRAAFEFRIQELESAWGAPGPGRSGMSTWQVQQALLRIARSVGSTVVAPGLRRLEQESGVSKKTVVRVLRDMKHRGQLVKWGKPLAGRPTPYQLRPGESDGGRPRLWRLDLSKLGCPGPARAVARTALLAFNGRLGALRIFLELGLEVPRTPTELRGRLQMPASTVKGNLDWLEHQEVDGVSWAVRAPTRESQWYRGFDPSIDDLVELAARRGALDRWFTTMNRIVEEQHGYDSFFTQRFGIDRSTGEILY
jgi:hypothetical protein